MIATIDLKMTFVSFLHIMCLMLNAQNAVSAQNAAKTTFV